ncbi:vitamin K epoxide reductase family protein, partial [Hallella sp.]|uniref:vitamin K epoxide reductase family protein n=1 Tax=Hallella sp. TaxID=2980186 RepID=UPI00283DBE27
MKNILEHFLDAIEVRYNRQFADKLYYEHPHRYNMYGLKKMLDVYGVKTVGIRMESKDLLSLNYPCILHTYSDFAIGLECGADKITFLQNGKTITTSHDAFRQAWTGNALVVEETTDADEPDYKSHHKEEVLARAKAYCIPVMLVLSAVMGIVAHIHEIGMFAIMGMLLNSLGVFVCSMLMQKQLMGESRYGDRVCSLFHHADCNSILDGSKAKFFGISWSEVGMGYFIASILLATLYHESAGAVAIINWLAMLYGVWSIFYQWRVAKSWCVLCVMTQLVIWANGIVAVISCLFAPLPMDVISSMLSCMVYGICIMAVHHYATAHTAEEERIRSVQKYRASKANNKVFNALIENGVYYETSLEDSSILFGNKDAKMRVTILSNPHCNPCARMHKRVENLLQISDQAICVQYIFSSFNKELEDSSRYLIYKYFGNTQD